MEKVAVAILKRINNDKAEYLLISSKKDFGKYTGFYYPPGGHMEEGESEEQCLIRELQEELSLSIKPIKRIAETKGDVKDQITYWWECEILDPKMVANNNEIADVRFVTLEGMKNLNVWPATKEFFDKYANEN